MNLDWTKISIWYCSYTKTNLVKLFAQIMQFLFVKTQIKNYLDLSTLKRFVLSKI